MSQARRIIGFAALALVAFLLGAWAFAAYLRPEMAFDFAALLQMCGIPITK
jgi:hypothetical protein